MMINIQRGKPTGRSTPGMLFLSGQEADDMPFECDTLEPDPNTPVHSGHPSIPAGTYKIALTMSPHMHYITPEVLDVPGRTAIRIHIANKPEDLLGCTAVGINPHADWVSSSENTFKILMGILNKQPEGSIEVTYTDAV